MRKTSSPEYHSLDCQVDGPVGKAIKIVRDGVVYMIPMSQVIKYNNTSMTMTAWIAKQKGLI